MATYYHANGGGNGGGNDWGSWIPIIVLFCIPTPVTWIIALIWLASKLRGGGKRGKNWQGGVKRHPYDIERERQAFVYGDAGRAIAGCIANGVPEDVAKDIYDEIYAFANYAFNNLRAGLQREGG